MTDVNQALLALAIASAASSCIAHGAIRDYRRACLVAAGLAVTSFQIGADIHLGYLDPFAPIAPIALVIDGGIAYVVVLSSQPHQTSAQHHLIFGP